MKSNNPDGRPNVLRQPTKITIFIEGDRVPFIKSYAKSLSAPGAKVTFSDAARRLIDKGLLSMGAPDDESEDTDDE